MRINNTNCTYNLGALEIRSLEKDFQGPMDPHRSHRGLTEAGLTGLTCSWDKGGNRDHVLRLSTSWHLLPRRCLMSGVAPVPPAVLLAGVVRRANRTALYSA